MSSLIPSYTDSEGEEEDRSERKRRSTSLNSSLEGRPSAETTEIKESSIAVSTASPSDSVVSGINTPQSGSSASGNSSVKKSFIQNVMSFILSF